MSKVAVVYWSMTGNTEAMAKELASAADTEAIESSEFSADMCDQYDAFAFGCPAMGDEELDPDFEELFNDCAGKLGQKPTALFGSYDWGQGGWMETWREEMINEGFSIVNDGLIIHLAVDDDEKIEKCKEYGKAIVG